MSLFALVMLLPFESFVGLEGGEPAESLDSSEEVEQVGNLTDDEGRRKDVARGVKYERGRDCGRRVRRMELVEVIWGRVVVNVESEQW